MVLSMKTTPLPTTLFDEANYRALRRVVFLFSALSTKSTLALPLLSKVDTKRARLDSLWIRANQAQNEAELREVLVEYQSITRQKLRSMDRVNLAIVATRLGDRKTAETAISGMGSLFNLIRGMLPKTATALAYQSINEGLNASFMFNRDYSVELGFLKLDVRNPFRANQSAITQLDVEHQKWVAALGKQLFASGTGTLEVLPGHGEPFDRLAVTELPRRVLARARAHEDISQPNPLVTVVVSAYRPSHHLVLAVKSILASTYRNLEVLVIDDASGNRFDGILAEVAALDSRVFVLRQKTNGGTYRIRNRALDEATGEFITFHDSDDWMHPLRIQLQVEHLQKHTKLMSNISVSTRVTGKLEAVESNRHLRVGLCEPALMFRRLQVKAKIGYFDSVRKGGDVEYRRRIDKAFGQKTVVVHPWFCLTLQRTDNGGLTEGELGYRWIAPYRTAHRDAYVHWQKVAHQEKHLRIDSPDIQELAKRPHFAPRQILFARAEATKARKFDVVFAADFGDKSALPTVLESISGALAENPKATIGLLACQSLLPLVLNRKFDSAIVELLNSGKVETVYPQDELTVKHLSVLTPSAFLNSQQPQDFNWKIADAGFVSGLESWQISSADEESAIKTSLGILLR